MTWSLERIDRDTLPAALLVLAKAQSRVTHTRDDAYLLELVGQSIDDIERQTNATIFDRTLSALAGAFVPGYWSGPYPAGAVPGTLYTKLPFNNVRTLTATDEDDTDLSLLYQVLSTDPGGVGTAVLVGPVWDAATAAGVVLAFEVGMTDPASIAPALRRAILRRCAALYENREAPLTLTEPDDATAPLLWRPAV